MLRVVTVTEHGAHFTMAALQVSPMRIAGRFDREAVIVKDTSPDTDRFSFNVDTYACTTPSLLAARAQIWYHGGYRAAVRVPRGKGVG